MKKPLFAIAVLAIVFLGYFMYPRHVAELPRVVALGDSLTYGTGSKLGGGYVKMLSDELGVPIENMGVYGDTTANALARLDTVLARKPKVVILLLGGNDFLRKVPEDITFANLGTIIDTLERSGVKVVLLGLQTDISDSEHRARFDALAARYKTAYVPDVLGGITGHLELMSDTLHPNDLGYKVMAEKIRPVLEEAL